MGTSSPEWDRFKELCGAAASVGPGARHIKVEFHCHTPASDDFEVRGAEGYDALAANIAAQNLDAVFVTDHNTWEGIGQLTEAVQKSGGRARVFPGVELTIVAQAARIGDGLSKEDRKIKEYFFHSLVLLPPSDQSAKQIETLVTNNFRNTDVLKLKPTERKLEQSLEEVAKAVREWGGIVLVAHFHQGKAPEKSRSHDDIYADSLAIQHLHQYFDAIEVREVQQSRFFDGAQTGSNGELIPEKACVLGSDAHRPEAVSEEPTWVLVEENTFEDIRTSLRYRERVLYDNPIAPKDMLLDLVIEGTFLGALHFAFNRGLTSLIGTKGAGKSAVLECIRFALKVPPAIDVEKYLTHVLGPAGRVWLSLRNRAGEEFLFIRGRGEATSKVVTPTGNVLQRDAVIPSNFPVEIRGWGELTRLAEDKAAQLQLLDTFDRSGGARAGSEKIRELRSDLPERFAQIRTTLEKLEATKTELDQLQLKKDRLGKLVVSNLIAEQQAKEQRDAELASYKEALRVLRENESISFKTISPESAEQLKTLRSAFDQGLLTANPGRVAREAIELAEKAQDELAVQASTSVKTLADAVEASLSELDTQFKPLEEKYQQLFTDLDPNEQTTLLARNDIIKEISRLPTVKARFEQLSADLTQRLRTYGDRLQAIQSEITRRSQSRADVLKKLNESLAAAKLGTRLKLDPCGSVRGNLPTGMQPATVFGVLANQFQALTPNDAIQRHYEIARPGGQREEFSLEIDDNPAIEFEKYPGVWQPSEQLSAGQKSTAVLPLVVMLGEGPIILDQPEDNLDNKYIGSTVVRMILAEKPRRQFVITSHNATLVVMSDSDLTVEMIDKDGKAQIVRSGFLNGPHSSIRQSVLEVLDGGETALRRRFSRYGVTPS